MDKKHIQSILQDALEHELPPYEIDLLPTVKERLVAGANQQGEKMKPVTSRRISRLALAGLTIAVLLAIAFVTPQGRAFAQSVLQFFKRSDGYVMPLPIEQIAPTPNPDSPEPTMPPPAPLMSMAEAENILGFDAKELPSDPRGFIFDGAMVGPGGISIQYQAQGNGGQLIINESNDGFMESDWDQAPAEFISLVKVGDLDAEFVQGAYVVHPGAATAEWSTEIPILRLRWIENGIYVEMAKFGDVESIAYLDKEGMIALAESMVYKP